MKNRSSLLAVAILSLFLAACGEKASAPAPAVEAPVAPAPAPAAPAAAAPAAAPVAENTVGKSAYNRTCALCHGAGVAGAPKPGDKEAWATRVAQGKETLYKHAIEGYTGEKGMMPAKGGNSTLSDDDVKAAVNFMADQSV